MLKMAQIKCRRMWVTPPVLAEQEQDEMTVTVFGVDGCVRGWIAKDKVHRAEVEVEKGYW